MNASDRSPDGIREWSYFYDLAEKIRLDSREDWLGLLAEIEYARGPGRRFLKLEPLDASVFRQEVTLRSGRVVVVEYDITREGTLEPVLGGLRED